MSRWRRDPEFPVELATNPSKMGGLSLSKPQSHETPGGSSTRQRCTKWVTTLPALRRQPKACASFIRKGVKTVKDFAAGAVSPYGTPGWPVRTPFAMELFE